MLAALPVEYIVETTATCNLYCPMCPRGTHNTLVSAHDRHVRFGNESFGLPRLLAPKD